MTNDNELTISVALSPRQAWAMAQIIKRLAVRDIGPADLKLANPHQPDEQQEAKDAFGRLENALAEAGFKPR
jgi:hypothetical protein